MKLNAFICGAAALWLNTACSTLDPTKERKDGNVVQFVEAQHVKTGRAFNSGYVPGVHIAQATSLAGASTGTSLAVGSAAILMNKLLDSTADDDDFYVIVSRPDDTLITGQPPRNPLGKIRFTTLMDGVRVGDWVKVIKTETYWTLIPCRFPESGCQDKVKAEALSSAK